MRKWLSFLLCISLLAVPCQASSDEESTAEKTEHQIVEKSIPFYLASTDSMDQTYYYADGEDGILWVDLESWLPIYQKLLATGGADSDLKLTGEAHDEIYKVKRENNAVMALDFEDDQIIFNDYNMFMATSYSASIIDLLGKKSTDSEGKPYVFQRQPEKSYDRPGGEKIYDLGSYGIHLIHQDGKYLVPMSTIVDIGLSPKNGLSLLYNGEGVFLYSDTLFGTPGNLTPYGELYYSAEPRERTEAEAEYGYNELCLVLDNFYGLKDIHKISSFDELFGKLGLRESLKSPDAGLADVTVAAIIQLYLADAHSAINMLSWMNPNDGTHKVVRQERTVTHLQDILKKYQTARSEYYVDGVPGYEEVGNTAFISFDSFASQLYSSSVIYSIPEDQMEQYIKSDTMALISYAHRQITRENSPIENVVLDLSCNGGGEINAAIFVISWFLGEAEIAFQDHNTGALSAAVYKADVNLDREFDEKDLLTGKNLYCLTSPYSFSCGNLVPAALKSSQKVTLMGQQSGGGSCVVAHAATTWGTLFQMSSSSDMSVFKNGSLYDIDQGVAPDIYLSKLSSFYDRTKLAKIINEMD